MGIKHNFKQFLRRFKHVIDNNEEARLILARELIITTYSHILLTSPVDSGRYRGANELTMNEPATSSPIDVRERDVALSQAQQNLDLKKGIKSQKVFITNPLVYAWRIENGHSKIQAPNGVYGVARRFADIKWREVLGK